jgi:3-oxoacyl-[acyl-carrier-protein] synthase-3
LSIRCNTGGDDHGQGSVVASLPDPAVARQPRPPASVASFAAIASWVPERAIAIETLREHLGLSPAQIKVLTRVHGLRELRVSDAPTLLDGLLHAGGAALRAAGDLDRVHYVLHAHTLQDIAPSTVSVVRDVGDALGLHEAMAFSVTQQNCASGLLAVDLAAKLLAADRDPDALALVLMGEKPFTPLAQLVPGTTIMGEAAAACLVSLDGEGDRVLAHVSRTLGQYSSALALEGAALRRFEQDYVQTLAQVMCDAVRAAGIELDDVALVLPHNVNRTSWVRLARHLEFPLERLYLANVPRLAHCFCADPFLNYTSACEQGLLRPGDHYVMTTVGLGATFTAVVVRH